MPGVTPAARAIWRTPIAWKPRSLASAIAAWRSRCRTCGEPIARLVDHQISTLADTPWLPPLIAREVLARESPLREFFAERLAKGPGVLIPQMLRREMEAGRIRDDLDPLLVMLSILGLGMVPYLMHPVAGPAFGYELDESFRDRMIAHVRALLARGLAPSEEER